MELLELTVPKDMCPLDFLAEMKDQTKNAWIFMHDSVVDKLLESDGVHVSPGIRMSRILSWAATEKRPAEQIVIGCFESMFWSYVIAIETNDIAFKQLDLIKPEYIICLKMAT